MPETRVTSPVIRMRGISKWFGPVRVLDDVDFEAYGGEVHVLAGENGAGKTTLIRILAGVYRDFDGRLEIDGRAVRPRSPRAAAALGVAVIHQELSLVPSLSAIDNMFLGRWPARWGWIQERAQHRGGLALLERFGIEIDPRRPVGELPPATQQLIEIAKASSLEARVIVLDEPTSALAAREVDTLLRILQTFKEEGRALVYITHRMEEIERVADRITVLRDGRRVASAPAREIATSELIRSMVGREIGEQFPRRRGGPGGERLRLERFGVRVPDTGGPAVTGVNLVVRRGEIVGLGGLQGSGTSELLAALFGAHGGWLTGTVHLDGEAMRIRHPRQALDLGIALVANDRKAKGLVLSMSVLANLTLADLAPLSPGGWRRRRLELHAAQRLSDALGIAGASLDAPVSHLSGGNQQKVVLGKALSTRPRLLLLDEPTKGIDVGAKRDVYELLNRWTAEGIAILLVTSELPELLALSDRILVLHRGRPSAELSQERASAEAVLAAAMGEGHSEVPA